MTPPQHAGRKLLAAVFATGLVLLAAPAASAHSTTPAARSMSFSSVTFRNVESDDCLQAVPGDEWLATESCTGQPEQVWNSLNGELENQATGECVQYFGNGDAHMVPCDGNPLQQWEGLERHWLQSQPGGACLADGGGYVYTTSCGDYPAERWFAKQAG